MALMSGSASAQISWKRVGTVTTLTNGQLCKNDGTNIICDSTTPTILGGKVGIGTTSPSVLLDLYNGPGNFINLGEGNSGNGASLYFTRKSDGAQRPFLSMLPTLNAPNEDIILGSTSGMWNSVSLQTNGGRIFLNAAGNVGIGTTAPAASVDVNGLIKVAGTGSEACSASTVGAIRYNAAGNYMEVCSYP